MPSLSVRSGQMPSSPIRRLMPSAEKAVAKGVTVLHLNIGQPDVEAPPEFWQALRDPKHKLVEYSHSLGIAALRAKVAESYCKFGIEVSKDEVIVCTAGTEALQFAMMSCFDPGDEVIVPEPFYANYLGFSVPSGAKIVPITTRIEDDFALPPVEEFANRITDRTKAILINNPGNPTGAVFDDAQLEGLRELALKHDLFLIADEVYREFNYSGKPVRSVLQLEGLEQHAIMADSVSKRFSLCGARIGFFVTRNKELLASATKFAQARLAPPTMEQWGVLGALDAPQSYFDAVRDEYVSRRDLLTKRLREMPGVVCPDVQGAFYAMVRLPIDDCDSFCQWILESFEHEGHTVMFAPGTGFYQSAGKGEDEVRIAYVLDKGRIALAMDCLERALKEYPGRTA